MQQQNSPDDNQFIYRYLFPVELTGVYAFYDVSHELGRVRDGDESDVARDVRMVGRQDHLPTKFPRVEQQR